MALYLIDIGNRFSEYLGFKKENIIKEVSRLHTNTVAYVSVQDTAEKEKLVYKHHDAGLVFAQKIENIVDYILRS